MKNNLLFIYSSVDGQTLKICNALRKQLKEHHQDVDLFSIDDFNGDLSSYNKIVIGSSIRYGVHNKNIIKFIKTHKEELESKTSIFFSVNLFAGKIDYKKYTFFDRKMIQLIMWMTKGPTNKDAEIEYTNWEKVKAFGLKLIDL